MTRTRALRPLFQSLPSHPQQHSIQSIARTRAIHTFSPKPPGNPFFPTAQVSERTRRTMSNFPDLAPLLAGNAAWAANTNAASPQLLPTLAGAQNPQVLWIGCADSRVPETTITGSQLGDIFVHRNVANQFTPEDASANAVLEFSVLTVGVKHVVVVGHTSCGGCIAAFGQPHPRTTKPSNNPLMQFLQPLVRLRHSLPEGAGVNDLIRENIRQGVQNVANSNTLKEAWATGKNVYVHGWMFDIASGKIEDLGLTVGPQHE